MIVLMLSDEFSEGLLNEFVSAPLRLGTSGKALSPDITCATAASSPLLSSPRSVEAASLHFRRDI